MLVGTSNRNILTGIHLVIGTHIGKTFENAQFTKENIIKAGFVDVIEHKYKVPVGTWSSDPKMKELGRWNALYYHQGIEGMCLFLLNKVMGVSISPVCGTIPCSRYAVAV